MDNRLIVTLGAELRGRLERYRDARGLQSLGAAVRELIADCDASGVRVVGRDLRRESPPRPRAAPSRRKERGVAAPAGSGPPDYAVVGEAHPVSSPGGRVLPAAEGGDRGALDKGVRVSDLSVPFGPVSKAPWRKP